MLREVTEAAKTTTTRGGGALCRRAGKARGDGVEAGHAKGLGRAAYKGVRTRGDRGAHAKDSGGGGGAAVSAMGTVAGGRLGPDGPGGSDWVGPTDSAQ